MKFIISFILTALLSLVACFYLPWWSIAIAAFIIAALIPQRPGRAFLTAFLALFILWGCLSFFISYNNDHLLARKVAMLILKMANPYLLMLVTAVIGGLVAGFAALTGCYLRRSNTASRTS